MDKEKDHPLVLKVMRLSCQAPMSNDSSLSTFRADTAIPIPQSLASTGLTHMYPFPQSFGNVYLGETLSCCLSVQNVGTESTSDISIKAVLQMSNQRIQLIGETDEKQPFLAPNEVVSKVFHHEIKEIGTHILVCAVHYSSVSGAETNFRKFFKFQVMKPFDVKTKFYNAESEDVYLEAGIQNISSSPIFLEKVDLDPAPCYTVTPLNSVSGEEASIFGTKGYLNPQDIRQYLYCLKPRPELKSNLASLKQASAIGKLDIVWRTSMGDKGRLQTSQLQRMVWASQYSDVKVMVEKIPSIACLMEPFEITLSIANISDKELKLHMDFLEGSDGTEWDSVTSSMMEPLPPGKIKFLVLTLMPVKTGLQTIAGVKITDTFLKRTYTYENLAQVFVTNAMSLERREMVSTWLKV